MKENKVGNIINDDLCYLTLNMTVTIQTSELHCEVDYDSRIIKDKKKLKQLTDEYFQNVRDSLVCK